MNIILFDDDEQRAKLLPLVYTRPVCELRVGILTIREKWEKHLKGTTSYLTQDYLAEKYPIRVTEDNIVINGGVCPSDLLVRLIQELSFNQALMDGDDLIAVRLDDKQFERLLRDEEVESLVGVDISTTPFTRIVNTYDIFQQNGVEIENDFELLTLGRTSQPISYSNRIVGDSEKIFIEEGAKVECAVLNTNNGPIYVGKNAEIMEGSVVRGGLAMNEGAVLKLSTKVYGPTTLGPYCKVGGEVNNVVFTEYSNKGHDGFLGNSVIGAWCNLGADTNCSNLKNNYGNVKVWSYLEEKMEDTGLMFCGLIMGDHSKCGINTMFNTGTIVGVNAIIYGGGFPRKFIPSFAWGGTGTPEFETHKLEKAFETATAMMKRRKVTLTEQDQRILMHVKEIAAPYRDWEKK